MIARYFKSEPTDFVLVHRRGALVQEGPGLSFWYLPYRTSVSRVPLVTQAAPFIFKLTSTDFQIVSLQGEITYRFADSKTAAQAFDLTIDPRSGRYATDDYTLVAQRVTNVVQAAARGLVSGLSLEQSLTQVGELTRDLMAGVRKSAELSEYGIEIQGLHIIQVTPDSDIKKALEADYREGLQRRADQAIYARRAAAVEEERTIREREMDTDIELENRKKDLVETQAENQLRLAESDAQAAELKLRSYNNMDPQALVGLALKEWAQNAGKIENLSITPDMLGRLVGWVADGKAKV